MKPFKSSIRGAVFSSRVARRIFLLFILCALIPLSVLAYLSFSQVAKSLYAQADESLHLASKASGMATFERLQFLEADLRATGATLEAKNRGAGADAGPGQELVDGFKGIVLADDGRTQRIAGTVSAVPRLTGDEEAHLRSGKPLVLTRRSHIYLLLARRGRPAPGSLLVAEINPAYLWNAEELPPLRQLFVLDESRTVLFSSFPAYSPGRELRAALRKNPSVGRLSWTYGNEEYVAGYWNLFMVPRFHADWILVQSERAGDILAPVETFKHFFLPLVLLAFFFAVLFSLVQIRRSLVPIQLLKEATRKIAARKFESRVSITTGDEFEELGGSFNAMAESLENHLRAMTILNGIGSALSAEKSNERLLRLILLGGKEITNADGCVLYVMAGDGRLRRSMLRVDSISRTMESDGEETIGLYDEEGRPDARSAIAYAATSDATVNIPDVARSRDFDAASLRDLDAATGYRTVSVLVVPVKNHEDETEGVLLLVNARDRQSGSVIPFSDDDRRLLEALASQAAVALSKNKLVEDFSTLFDSLVELIATAIDKKSPHTGDHCRRVPELTMMLAEAVSARKDGVFKDVTLSEEELHELKIAAFLHDCGKVTTPVHIADKATRLETISDRIHLIEARFEIVKREERIAALQRQCDAASRGSGTGLSAEKEALEQTLARVDEDRDFVRSCNSSRVVMDEDRRTRIEEIGRRYRWTNAEGREESVLSAQDIYMLTSAVRGTLTPAEREVINQHVEITIKMLESLHYPKSLRNVPFYARAHHERFDGKGYPLGLKQGEIPLQGRIMAIADIFEAITAQNRPYKRPMTLMKAVCELGSMKQAGHIDPDLFDVFITEKIYLRYAEKYLPPAQIDDVVLSDIPGYKPS